MGKTELAIRQLEWAAKNFEPQSDGKALLWIVWRLLQTDEMEIGRVLAAVRKIIPAEEARRSLLAQEA